MRGHSHTDGPWRGLLSRLGGSPPICFPGYREQPMHPLLLLESCASGTGSAGHRRYPERTDHQRHQNLPVLVKAGSAGEQSNPRTSPARTTQHRTQHPPGTIQTLRSPVLQGYRCGRTKPNPNGQDVKPRALPPRQLWPGRASSARAAHTSKQLPEAYGGAVHL